MSRNQSCSPTIIFRGALTILQDLGAEIEFLAAAELGQIAAEENEIGLRVERVDLFHRLHGGPYETVVDFARVEMGVGDIGDGKARRCGLRRLRDFDKLEALRNDQPLRGGDPGGNSGNVEKAAPGERAHSRKVFEE